MEGIQSQRQPTQALTWTIYTIASFLLGVLIWWPIGLIGILVLGIFRRWHYALILGVLLDLAYGASGGAPIYAYASIQTMFGFPYTGIAVAVCILCYLYAQYMRRSV